VEYLHATLSKYNNHLHPGNILQVPTSKLHSPNQTNTEAQSKKTKQTGIAAYSEMKYLAS